jgi:septum formation protein
MYEILLVSASPRRQQILAEAGYLFRTDPVKISEIIEQNVNLETAIRQIAKAKAQAYLDAHNYLKKQKIIVLSADTMVILNGEALGKPKNSTEAELFLRRLSGQKHRVVTAIYMLNLSTNEEVLDADTTEVEFRELTENEIKTYVESGEPFDKAGAYAIQGEGRRFVKQISGSLLNVIGLPLELLESILREKNWYVERKSKINSK